MNEANYEWKTVAPPAAPVYNRAYDTRFWFMYGDRVEDFCRRTKLGGPADPTTNFPNLPRHGGYGPSVL